MSKTICLLVAISLLPGSRPVVVASSPQIVLKASTYDVSVKSGDRIAIRLEITNESSQDIVLVDTDRGCDYVVDIKREDGTPVPELSAKKEKKCGPESPNARNIRVLIKPQETTRDGITLNEFADLSAEGTYTVRIGRILPPSVGKEVIWSNALTIAVKS
jgi:hypothetical protein